jgi:nucleoside 2-deoxyribosyltransferase
MIMRVFLAGIMQGSNAHNGVHAQDYRATLAGLLRAHVPGVEIFDPWAAYPDSPSYPDEQVKTVLVANVAEAAACDLVIAYLPQASMGTALEMWEAWRAGVPVVAITPLAANWVVRTCAVRRFDTLDDFEAAVRQGEIAGLTAPAI